MKYIVNKKLPRLHIHDHFPTTLIRSIALFLPLLLIAMLAISTPNTRGSIINLTLSDITAPTVQIVSPRANAHMATTSSFNITADLANTSVNSYDMFWYIDNGAWNWMGNNGSSNTKQASINLTNWTWRAPSDQYVINIVAVIHTTGKRIYSSIPIYVDSGTTTSNMTNTASSLPTNFYVNPNSNAAQAVSSTSDSTTKRVMTKLAATPTALWFGGWNQNIYSDVESVVTAAGDAGKTPVLVAYNIPDRDCNGYSSGGAHTAAAYQKWIKEFAAGIGSRSAIVILEPDAVAQATCLSNAGQDTRYKLLHFAIGTLKANRDTRVYLDAGNPSWVAAKDMASRLTRAGIANADGFSLNVSNFIATSDNIDYGRQISALIGKKHFVIDTSRNGNGSNGEWCNPSGRALGRTPTANTGDKLVDYFLWIKTPGESDGTCNGGPTAGTWWPAYAQELAINSGW